MHPSRALCWPVPASLPCRARQMVPKQTLRIAPGLQCLPSNGVYVVCGSPAHPGCGNSARRSACSCLDRFAQHSSRGACPWAHEETIASSGSPGPCHRGLRKHSASTARPQGRGIRGQGLPQLQVEDSEPPPHDHRPGVHHKHAMQGAPSSSLAVLRRLHVRCCSRTVRGSDWVPTWLIVHTTTRPPHSAAMGTQAMHAWCHTQQRRTKNTVGEYAMLACRLAHQHTPTQHHAQQHTKTLAGAGLCHSRRGCPSEQCSGGHSAPPLQLKPLAFAIALLATVAQPSALLEHKLQEGGLR